MRDTTFSCELATDISVCRNFCKFLVQIFSWVFNIIYVKDLSLQVVQLNSLGGATIVFAAYSVYGRIFARPFFPKFFVGF